MAQITVGTETECWLLGPRGFPVEDVLKTLGGGKKTGCPFEELTGDMERRSLEFVSTVGGSGADMCQSFNRLLALLPRGFLPMFRPRLLDGPVQLAQKTRMTAVRDALAREHSNGANGVKQVAEWASLQFQLGAGRSLLTPAGMFFRETLENYGPYARLAAIERYGIEGWQQHQQCWYGFSKEERTPAPRQFRTPEAFTAFVCAIPKLVTKVNGDWVVANEGTMSSPGDPESDGTLWWSARYRRFPDGGETIEWRPFESMLPEYVIILTDDVVRLATAFWEFVDDHPEADWTADSWRRRMHAHLRAASPFLVPENWLSDDEWWRLTRH